MATVMQRSMAAGEISGSLGARADIVKYSTGLRTCRNFMVQKFGGVESRAGGTWIGPTRNSGEIELEMEFIFNDDQTYNLIWGKSYMRVIKDGQYIFNPQQSITAISAAVPPVVTTGAPHGVSNGEHVYVQGTLRDDLNDRWFRAQNIAASTMELEHLDGTDPVTNAVGTGGTIKSVFELVTPYGGSDTWLALKYAQSADVVNLTNDGFAPQELKRLADNNWTITTKPISPSIAAPANVVTDQTAGTEAVYVVTSIKKETFEESLASGEASSNVKPTTGTPVTVSWDVESAAQEYNVYKKKNGIFGFIGTAGAGESFEDDGVPSDASSQPPIDREAIDGNAFLTSVGNRPNCVAYYQQRLLYGGSINQVEGIWSSRIGDYSNFTLNSPTTADAPVTLDLVGRLVNRIEHMLDLGQLVIFTSGGEYILAGDGSGALTPLPGGQGARQQTYHGSGLLRPLIIGGTAVFLQRRGNIIRDLQFEFASDRFQGNDLTVFATHLFRGFTVTSWAYQELPESIIWATRDDGTLLGLTYIREQEIVGWHRHDFAAGNAVGVNSIPEGGEDSIYMIIDPVNIAGGTTKIGDRNYVERINTRLITDIRDFVAVDSAKSYDRRNTTGRTMTLTGGTLWDHSETLTLTASGNEFVDPDDIGNEVYFYASNGDLIRVEIEAITNAAIATVRPVDKVIPTELQNSATTNWEKAVRVLKGLWHLEGEDVSVFADALVVASPNNDSMPIVTVANGEITLDKPASVVHVGMPITCDLETLDIDSPSGVPMINRTKNLSKLTIYVKDSIPNLAGPNFEDGSMDEFSLRLDEEYDEPVALQNGKLDVNIPGDWNRDGRIALRQIDPVPLTVLAIAPAGFLPTGRQ